MRCHLLANDISFICFSVFVITSEKGKHVIVPLEFCLLPRYLLIIFSYSPALAGSVLNILPFLIFWSVYSNGSSFQE